MNHDAHPASAIFPMMEGADLEALEDDIREHGLLEPIVLYEGMILDGRNRALVCAQLGIEPQTEEADLGGSTPLQYVISKNLHRRHLSVAQRAAIALELLPEFEAEGKERMSEGGKRGRQTVPGEGIPETGDLPKKGITSSRRAAELVGVGHSSIEAAKSISKRDPSLIERMRAGEINIAQAARLAGFSELGQGGHIGHVSARDENGKVIHYGKGDKWEESTSPLRRYLVGWRNRGFNFKHLNAREARTRLRVIQEIEIGLADAKRDLEQRAHKATLRVEG